MHVKLLKELLNLDTSQYVPTLTNISNPHREKMQKKVKITQKEEPDDISSNLMKAIVDANEPIDLDLESISDYSDSSISSSYDSFYEL
jgi:hypothetical protein